MASKYRVHEVAKDLRVTSKEIVGILKQYLGVSRTYMTALETNELDLIFDYYTQKNEIEDFNEYFSLRREDLGIPLEELAPLPGTKQAGTASGAGIVENSAKVRGSENTTGKEFSANFQNSQDKAPKNNAPKPKQKRESEVWEKTVKIQGSGPVSGVTISKEADMVDPTQGKLVDTRTVKVDIEKYNEKYDRMAEEKMHTEVVVKKQKINQRLHQRSRIRSAKRETEAERLKRIAQERKERSMTISIPEEIAVSELASRLKATSAEIIRKLMALGMMVSINDFIDFDTASLVAMEFHAKAEKEIVVTIEDKIIDDHEDRDEDLVPRAPIVVVMGHVDHGKTSLLDAIRHTNVISTESGGITQHIGAYSVRVGDKQITFLDTPGHEAFTSMRARGAQITDIAILVVSADDGIMPQTVEAINHAKDAGISIIVAINKIDKEGADVNKVKQQLTEHGILPEEWGGDVPCVPISAKTKEGIDSLLEMVTLVADLKELKANPNRAAKGTIIEARLDKGRGPIATVLVQNGTLKKGDTIVAGETVGHVRTMVNDLGMRVKEAGPSIPVEITGLDGVPFCGDVFDVVSDEKLARQLVEQRKSKKKEDKFDKQTKVTLSNFFDQMKTGNVKELKIIVKADVQGSVEALWQSLERLTNPEVRVKVIHGAVGAVNESDVVLANASNAIIVGFNVRPEAMAAESAERHSVDIRLYRVIYDCLEEIQSAMKGMLDPKYREVVLGQAECRQIYKISSVGTIAGSYVTSGKITRSAEIRVIRDGIVVAEDKIKSLRRFKDDVKEVTQGYECGIGLEHFNDIKEGDVFEAFYMEEYRD